ncbi:MAG: hypothetical protein ACUVST_14135 [Anaerolineae bacterium]
MRAINVIAKREIAAQDDKWVREAQELVRGLKGQDKHGQLRNIQAVAEESNSWSAVALFIRYQGARDQVPKQWAENAVKRLEGLQADAKELASKVPGADEKAIHMEIISRVLGFAVRWHIWDVKGKGKEESQ